MSVIVDAGHAGSGMNVQRLWDRLSPLPGGGWLFSKILSLKVPYTGTINPRILKLESGVVTVAIKDCRRVRNHLQSIHAIALMNLGEVATGLAVLSAIPITMRAIIVHLEIDFLKKARGTIHAHADATGAWSQSAQTDWSGDGKNLDITADLVNDGGQVVARVHAQWRVSSKPSLESKERRA